MTIEIDNHGALVQLSISVWSGRVKFPAQLLNKDANPEWLRATKSLIDKNALRPIESARSDARSWLSLRSLNFPITGVAFVPNSLVPMVDEQLEKFRQRFYFNVDQFTSNYDTFVEQAKDKLKDLYNPADYPQDISDKFGFRWRFFQVAAPSENSVIDPAILRRQQQEFSTMMGEFRAEAALELRDRFAELVEHVSDRLTPDEEGNRKVFRNSLITNFEEFLGDFEALNFTQNAELSGLVDRAREALSGVNPKRLRENKSMRDRIGQTFSSIQEDVGKMMVDAPTRRVRVARPSETA